MATFYDHSAKTIAGHEISLKDYAGKVVLVVNTASKCGFTPQYEGLEKLYKQYRDQGLVILGFPCNQFGAQEPGSEAEIAKFCSLSYGVSFPMFARVEVNGDGAHPLYQYLKAQQPGLLGIKSIKWNFTKFLVDKNGKVVERFAPQTKPEALANAVESLLS